MSLVWVFSCFFFLSSRRRHTRFSRDWSSDVCSSDLWETGDPKGLSVENTNRVRLMLLALDKAARPEEMNLPGYRFHALRGKPRRWSLTVTGNWRLTFGWEGENAIDVNLE